MNSLALTVVENADHSPELVIRAPVPADRSALADLFCEMQSHYGRPVSSETAMAAAATACKPPKEPFGLRVLLSTYETRVVGSLVMNVSFPAFELTRSLYIRDLYVSRRMRRHGIGRALVKAAAKLAVEQGFSALEWTTDSGNSAARAMYEACGARRLERTYYRLFDEALIEASR